MLRNNLLRRPRGRGRKIEKNFRTKEYRSLFTSLFTRLHKRLWNLSDLYPAFTMEINLRRPWGREKLRRMKIIKLNFGRKVLEDLLSMIVQINLKKFKLGQLQKKNTCENRNIMVDVKSKLFYLQARRREKNLGSGQF